MSLTNRSLSLSLLSLQLISECKDAPLNLRVGLKVKDELGMGVDEIKVVVNGETITWEVEKLQIRRPVPFALVIEGPQVTLFMGGKEISAKPWQGVIPPIFGKARVGSTNSFAGVIKDLFLFDGVFSYP